MSSVPADAPRPVEGSRGTIYAVVVTLSMIIIVSKVAAYRRNLKVCTHSAHDWAVGMLTRHFSGCKLLARLSRSLPSEQPTGSLHSDNMVESQFLLRLEVARLQ